jgi:hypothetical protein
MRTSGRPPVTGVRLSSNPPGSKNPASNASAVKVAKAAGPNS